MYISGLIYVRCVEQWYIHNKYSIWVTIIKLIELLKVSSGFSIFCLAIPIPPFLKIWVRLCRALCHYKGFGFLYK